MLRISLINNTIRNIQIQQHTIYTRNTYEYKYIGLEKSKSNLDNLVSELNKVAEPQKQKQSYSDDRFWKPELDKSNGYAVFRFLPAVKGEDLPEQDYVSCFSS